MEHVSSAEIRWCEPADIVQKTAGFHDGSRLFVLSATGAESGDLAVTEMDEDLRPVTSLRMSDPAREQNFPVGNLLDGGAVFVTCVSRDRGRTTCWRILILLLEGAWLGFRSAAGASYCCA